MKKIIVFLLILSTGLMFSCKSGSGDPKVVLSSFLEALSKKDITTARKYATAESKSMLDMMEIGIKQDKSDDNEKYNMANMQFGDAVIEGDMATIPVTEKTSNETIKYNLKKENGAWKVAFDKGAVMKTATEKLNEKGVDLKSVTDSLEVGLEALKDVDMDSLKAAMNEGFKDLDSIKKILEKNQ